ncbi:type II toxin-antitoxin system VapC family toxin [Opitutus sp. GAS368]|uniref:type II toxin-antitoxin system VapC family toxin n=1 Tax=Opitutus sp. GAS368 TaxID=1882749 RepID=UPI00087BC9BD|nr:type II toxin-antitoxin system VapC family toxin [Opitutus sp. GAS368]SDS46167.1 Predicted nucleic acid-binding protein, contains PIN domain [Opitutus sp. GAS368]
MAFDLYLDTSALVKLYVREPETAELSAFVRKSAPPLPFSSLHELELTHALERRREEGDLSTIGVNQIVGSLDKDLKQGVLARPGTEWPGIFARAIHLLRQHRGLRSLDALHIGHALESGAIWFVTYDRRQGKAAAGEGLKLWPKNAG